MRLAREVGLVKGEWIAIDGSKFRAVSSAAAMREREAVKRYLDELEAADEHDEVVIDGSAMAAALEKLKNDPEPEARFMRTREGVAPAYNVQTAVDAEHGLIVAQQVSTEANDERSLLPMAEAAKEALGAPETLHIIADAGYSNGEQAAQCEGQGIVPHVPANRAINHRGMARCSTARCLSTTKRPTLFAVLRTKPNPPSQADAVSQEKRDLCGRCEDLFGVSAEVAMHQHDAPLCAAAHPRCSAAAHERASNGAGNAVATLHSRAAVRAAEMGDLRAPPIPAPRIIRCASRNQPRNHGLQPENHDARAGRQQTARNADPVNTSGLFPTAPKNQKAP